MKSTFESNFIHLKRQWSVYLSNEVKRNETGNASNVAKTLLWILATKCVFRKEKQYLIGILTCDVEH